MKIYKTQSEVEKDIKNNLLEIDGDVKFECSISISASIKVNAGNISARNIKAWDINANDITAWDITANDITAWDITAEDITAWDINANDINAGNITARNISYFAFCCVYESIKCFSIRGTREKHQDPICLDGNLEIEANLKSNKVIRT